MSETSPVQAAIWWVVAPASAIGLYGLVADGEAGAQIYAAGATKEQASILFRDAVNMLDNPTRFDGEWVGLSLARRHVNKLATSAFFDDCVAWSPVAITAPSSSPECTLQRSETTSRQGCRISDLVLSL
ncbi:hypothetical protein [Rhodovulum sulfidophilum]|uniref:hypothetical protein n=1 Tax=Rhodovulum sulfidophilum TaxID=35806 RepID=UPI0019230301|nr:hypothetical protein [Rhodovulum sulfidophilum]MBL3562650.1 hypothetical protein [Rhodovulum sulfidophilum]